MHLIHDIDPLKTKSFVRAVVEISQGSKQKYEVDPEYGILSLDRTVPTACRYPVNYGFIPRTLGIDGDALDIFLFAQESIQPGTLVTAKPIGLFDLVTDGESDHKVIAVIKSDPAFGLAEKIEDLPKFLMRELEQFLFTYKQLENKKVKVGPFLAADKAWEMIHETIKSYSK